MARSAASARSRRAWRGTPHQASAASTFARAVRLASAGACSAAATRPCRSIVPPAGAIRPASAASSVDLPAPLGPSTASTSPRRSARSTSWTTGVPARAAVRPRASSSGSVTTGRPSTVLGLALLDRGERGGEEQDEPEQQDAERDRGAVLAGGDADEHGAGQRLRLTVDVAADEDDGADLGERGADGGDRGGEHADARLAQGERGDGGAGGAERARLVEQSLGQRLDGGGGERGDDREREDRLGEDHAVERVEQVEPAERSAAEQQQRDDESDDHRREAHAGVDERQGAPAAAEPGESEQRGRAAGRRRGRAASTRTPCAASRRRCRGPARRR